MNNDNREQNKGMQGNGQNIPQFTPKQPVVPPYTPTASPYAPTPPPYAPQVPPQAQQPVQPQVPPYYNEVNGGIPQGNPVNPQPRQPQEYADFVAEQQYAQSQGQAPQGAPRTTAYYGGYQQAPPQHYAAQYPANQYNGYYPQKQKMNTGLKVFIWVISILAVGTILGFVAFTSYAVSHRSSYDSTYPYDGNFSDFYESEEPILPYEKTPENVPDNEEPDYEEPAEQELPDIPLNPNPEGIVIDKKPVGAELKPEEIYTENVDTTVAILSLYRDASGQEATGTGTGIVATEDGYIITNSHLVMHSKSTQVSITTFDGEEHDAIVVGVDRSTDLAVLKMDGKNMKTASFGSVEEMEIGEDVIVIGNPGGPRFSGSLTDGLISGLDREVGEYSESGMTYIQTNAAINPGNSGGPLLNMYGQVIGINSSKIVSSGYEGMGFAIPVSKAQDIINELMQGGYVKGRTRLGIIGSDITEIEAMYGMPRGFRIIEINEESVFSGTKVQEGDIIIGIDGTEVSGLASLSNQLLTHAPGDKVKLTIFRREDTAKGSEFEVEITLLEDKGETQK